jgi:CBS domain-containing protein/ribosome-associated translation inhibitor RaiA
MKSRPALADLIREEADKLQEFFDHIIDCHVVVDVPHRHHRKGNHVRVRLELSVPHDLLVVARDPPLHAEHEDPALAVRDAFHAARRQLQDYARRKRGEVKQHIPVRQGLRGATEKPIRSRKGETSMKLEQIMTRQLFTCRPEDTLQVAAGIMWDHDIGCIPVVPGDDTVLGVITDRDLAMSAYLAGRPLTDVRVKEAMSRELFTVRPHDEIRQLEDVMRTKQVHRVPVVDDAGRLLGIVSLNDLTRTVLGRKERDGVIGAAAIAATLAAVGAPRTLALMKAVAQAA